jgi:hypothetical protein
MSELQTAFSAYMSRFGESRSVICVAVKQSGVSARIVPARSQRKVGTLMHAFSQAMFFVGCITTSYFGVRVGATVIDLIDRARTGNWEV